MTAPIHWYDKDNNAKHDVIFTLVTRLAKDQSERLEDFSKYYRLYGNMSSSDALADVSNLFQKPMPRVTLNVVRAVIDTVVARISKNEVRPLFLTSGGDWAIQERAKLMTKFVEGQLRGMKAYPIVTQIFRDACICGKGIGKIIVDNCDGEENLSLERVQPTEVFVDTLDAMYGTPLSYHQVKNMHKSRLIDKFPNHKVAIEDADLKAPRNLQLSERDGFCTVIESWKVSEGSSKGRHIICCSNVTLLDEEYDEETPPFVFLDYSAPVQGFYGMGIAENLMGTQVEINKTLRTIQLSMHLTAIPKVFIDSSTKVAKAQINNEVGGIISYTGTKPSYESVGSVPPELLNWVKELYARAFELEGVSQLSATSRKPAGLDSGVALREFTDIESERFFVVAKAHENYFLDLSALIISSMNRFESDPIVRLASNKFLEIIRWSDVNMDEDKYLMQTFPANLLPTTPAGRISTIQELMQAGLIDIDRGRALLSFPDLESVTNYLNSPVEIIEMIIDSMLTKGKYLSPEPYMGKDVIRLGLTMVTQAYLFSQTRAVPEEKLDLLRNWIDAADAMLKEMVAQEQQALPVEPALPAVAEAAPVNELLPIA